MIIVYIGGLGSGKTCSAVRTTWYYYKKGFKIYSNIHLKFPYTLVTTDLLDGWMKNKEELRAALQNSVFLLDEAHIWMDSRSGMKKKQKKRTYFVLQIRKLNVMLIVTTQSYDQVDKRLRNSNNYLVRCESEKIKYQMTNGQVALVVKIHQEALDMGRQHLGPRKMNPFDARPYFGLYDTLEIVDIDEEEEE